MKVQHKFRRLTGAGWVNTTRLGLSDARARGESFLPVIVGLPLIISILLAPAGGHAQTSTTATSGVRFDQHLGETMPLDAAVTDEYGAQKKLGDFFGHRPVIFVLSYYRCPNLCTLVLNGVVDAIKPAAHDLGREFDVVTVSIDPEEKPALALAKKRAYLARLGFAENETRAVSGMASVVPTESLSSSPSEAWHFLTARQQEIKRVADAAGFYFQRDEKSGEFMHPSGIVVVGPTGIITQYFFGIQFDQQKLSAALSAAKAGRTGSVVDRILLYCFHYNPTNSANGPIIMKSIRVAGATGAAMIFMLIGLLLRNGIRETSV